MKKQFLIAGLVAAMIGSTFASCSSSKNASTADTTMKDTSKMSATPPPTVDTTKKDTMKKDTTHH